MKYDLIIVGSGSVGAASGCYATRAGLKVLMIDSGHPPHDQGSHHGSTRLMRHAYGEGERYVPLVLRAQQLWNELSETSGEKVFHHTGVVNLGPVGTKFINAVASSAEKFSLPVEILDSAAVSERWPGIVVPANYTAVFEPNSGVLKSEIAVRAYIRLAKEGGCTQLFNCRVTEIRHGEEGATVVTEQGEYQTSKLLVSAGTWVTKLLPELPVQPVRKVFAFHQADSCYNESNKFPGFIAASSNGDLYYGFPAANNEMKVCKHNGGQNIDSPEQRTPYGTVASDASELFPFMHELLPRIGACLRGGACTYGMSPDEDFIIDTLPGHNNTLIIGGLSGHGFKFSSVLGEIACQFALGQQSKFDLSPFALTRFAVA